MLPKRTTWCRTSSWRLMWAPRVVAAPTTAARSTRAPREFGTASGAVAPAIVHPVADAAAPTLGGQLSYVSVGVVLRVVFVKSKVLCGPAYRRCSGFNPPRDRQRRRCRDTQHSADTAARPSLSGRTSDYDSAERDDASGRPYWLGGTLFGLGWGLLGACPGPICADWRGRHVESVALLSALAGTWLYGTLQTRLPH